MGIKRRNFIKGLSGSLVGSLLKTNPVFAKNSYDVAIIGAGLAGLNAAILLEKLGLKVIVLEANNRVGGKLLSEKNLDGTQEIGGTSIGSGYTRLNRIIDELNLDYYVPSANSPYFDNRSLLISIKDSSILSRSDWINSEHNPFKDEWREKYPWESLRAFINNSNPLESVNDWYNPNFYQHDISLYEALSKFGFNKDQITMMSGINPAHGDNAKSISVLQHYFSSTWVKNQRLKMDPNKPPIFQIVGGNDRIPKRMSKLLRGDLALDYTVKLIEGNKNGVTLTNVAGKKLTASTVVSTIPLNALSKIEIRLDGMRKHNVDAIKSVGYSKVYLSFFKINNAYWQDGNLPSSMWTDTDLGRVFTVPGANGTPAYLKTWATGNAASKLDAMDQDLALRNIHKKLINVRPSLRGNIQPISSWSWQKEEGAGGTYVAWQPNQIKKYSNTISSPIPPLFLAGEYSAKTDRGMEGAMESGERAANEVIHYLGVS